MGREEERIRRQREMATKVSPHRCNPPLLQPPSRPHRTLCFKLPHRSKSNPVASLTKNSGYSIIRRQKSCVVTAPTKCERSER